jgi:hypothetical protein
MSELRKHNTNIHKGIICEALKEIPSFTATRVELQEIM